LVKNKIPLETATDHWSIPIHIHTTASGGTNDAAIATHAIHIEIFLYLYARNAIHQDAKAIPKSIIVGCVLIKISLVSSDNGTRNVRNIAVIILNQILLRISTNHFPKSFLFQVVIPNEIA
jgi:hypothetical protein